jgi:Flp pilus assembly protein TadD
MRKRFWTVLLAVAGLLLPLLAQAQDPVSLAREKIGRYKQAATAAAAPPMAPIARRDPPDRNDLLDALGLFQSAGAGATKDAGVRTEYTELLELLGYYDLSAVQLERAAAEAPQDAALWRAAGRAWAESGPAGDGRALADLEKSRELDPDSGGAAEAWFLTGRVQHRAGQYEAAAQSYAEALKRKADHAQALIGKAALDTRAGKLVEASAALDALGKAAQPFDVDTRTLLRKALADFQAGGAKAPDDAAAQAAYAKLLYRAARVPDAVAAARRAVELKPDDVDTLNFLAVMLLQAGNSAQAKEVYEKSLAVRPDQPNVTEVLKQLGGQR